MLVSSPEPSSVDSNSETELPVSVDAELSVPELVIWSSPEPVSSLIKLEVLKPESVYAVESLSMNSSSRDVSEYASEALGSLLDSNKLLVACKINSHSSYFYISRDRRGVLDPPPTTVRDSHSWCMFAVHACVSQICQISNVHHKRKPRTRTTKNWWWVKPEPPFLLYLK